VVNVSARANESTLGLSRKFEVYKDPARPWISVYGGKLTGCERLAQIASAKISRLIGSRSQARRPKVVESEGFEQTAYPGLAVPVPTLRWCVNRELCCTLDDYLRRRTNIAQWVPRGGLGRHNEYRNYLTEIAGELPSARQSTAAEAVGWYESSMIDRVDNLIAAC
jgi:glycerol-3-phosphate dehydrogenase